MLQLVCPQGGNFDLGICFTDKKGDRTLTINHSRPQQQTHTFTSAGMRRVNFKGSEWFFVEPKMVLLWHRCEEPFKHLYF